ncbi:amino acid ABC transporter permease [Neobacillus thermocopriae]|uniref:Amino acid ABC transporter permease n=1 Tax=Neobacillus thermocopriae TaxID=1215031 RepID=A0A6B3TP12_9BACI|nr:amino acid ABC transporter permease [Neobacillus thermocopriae]MED3624770.1 amino acid ABC transporter permease [Neobacillus thermocopriae]MED3713080.1 amino acid ABC transporter permease [Neobacillus thermocopriae]NEX78543.1 amino acid ABC transporter permease [Neobacillus thermocopriae]
MDIRWDLLAEYAPFFVKGTLLTIGLSVCSILLGTIFGLFIGLGKMAQNKLISLPFNIYITFFRGTPLLVQILLVHFGLVPLIWGETNGILAAIIALSLNSAAYVAEIFRAGIQSIDKGQMEAARSLGMNHVQAMRYVILPQAFKRMIPPLGNEFIVLIKDSSLAAIIAAKELMYWGQAMQGQYYRVWEPYLTAALIYLVLTFSLSLLLSRLERRLAVQ